jgi:hypothetical protein
MAWESRDNRFHRAGIDRHPGKRTVEVNDMKVLRPGFGKEQGLGSGIIAVHRCAVHIAFGQPDNLSAFEINGRKNDQAHGVHSKKRDRKSRP